VSEELNLETMPLADLKKLALEEAAKEAEAQSQTQQTQNTDKPRNADGTFAKRDRAESEATPDPNIADSDEPEEFIVRREIDLGDGSGVQVFTGKGETKDQAFEDFADKVAEAQKNATKKIRAQQAELDALRQKSAQKTDDDEYVIKKQLDEKPAETIKRLVAEQLAEEQARTQRSQRTQNDFVAAHPEYIANESNGSKIRDWVANKGYTEFTDENLEKAYQDLKASGLLKLKSVDASENADVEAADDQRIADNAAKSTAQSRSQRKGSSVSSRGGAPVVKTGPSEDELYNMPLEDLRRLSNEQLAKSQQ
jgi:hypothetical protein